MMWRASIASFLCLTLVDIRTHWIEACPTLEKSAEVPWIRASSTIHLRSKEKDYLHLYDYDETDHIIRRRKTPREVDLERRLRREYSQADEGSKSRIVELQNQLDEEIRRIEEQFAPKGPKRNSFMVFLRKLGPQKRGRRRRRRRRNLHEPDPKPQRMLVRVHEPAQTRPPATEDDDAPTTSPPIVYAPPVPEEKYPTPVKRPGRYTPPVLSSSQETNSSTDSDIYDQPSRRVYRPKKKRTRLRGDDWDDDRVQKVHVYWKGSPPPELANVSSDRRRFDDSDEDDVRQVHLMRDFLPPRKSKRRRQVAKSKLDVPARPPLKSRQSSGPVPVVF